MPFDFKHWAERHRQLLEKELFAQFPQSTQIGKACQYPLQTGGKRIRPLLVFAASEAFGQSLHPDSMLAAIAIEFIHTYSLVHDDLPSMDDDDYRRGKPTVHRVFGVPAAILAGDALLTDAFRVLSRVSPHKIADMLELLATASGVSGMIGGQSMDIGFEGTVDDLSTLKQLHLCKTGALISASVQLGGLAASASEEERNQLREYGEAVGLAFQLADDILDADQDAEADLIPSFVKLIGIEQTQNTAKELVTTAINLVQNFPSPAALISLAEFSIQRSH